MTFTIRLEHADGTPADPPTIESTVTNWRVGDTIPLGRERTLRTRLKTTRATLSGGSRPFVTERRVLFFYRQAGSEL
jgi:hypothetical protein